MVKSPSVKWLDNDNVLECMSSYIMSSIFGIQKYIARKATLWETFIWRRQPALISVYKHVGSFWVL